MVLTTPIMNSMSRSTSSLCQQNLGKRKKKKNHSKTGGDDHQKWIYKTNFGFKIILGYPLLISPPQCQGRMWHRCWGGHSEASVLAAFGRAPQWRRASGETAGADRPPNRYIESVCTPEPVSGCCRHPQLYWTLVLYFPGEQVEILVRSTHFVH